jgi:hypothetical protein
LQGMRSSWIIMQPQLLTCASPEHHSRLIKDLVEGTIINP